MFRVIRALLGGGQEWELYECRHCGASVDEPGEPCPDCGAAEIARFTL